MGNGPAHDDIANEADVMTGAGIASHTTPLSLTKKYANCNVIQNVNLKVGNIF